ncbi:hypothetical protein ZIOFF_031846 [Zingiber officinale]|uniref:Homeobox domain-containing protein n=1 Tax=Zingiber officinale TaxID=94328 RepID=A0A8J5GFH1_ZINOF|nr:hypothetical protein ZIOFF_031846 [Zingiber officinale]
MTILKQEIFLDAQSCGRYISGVVRGNGGVVSTYICISSTRVFKACDQRVNTDREKRRLCKYRSEAEDYDDHKFYSISATTGTVAVEGRRINNTTGLGINLRREMKPEREEEILPTHCGEGRRDPPYSLWRGKTRSSLLAAVLVAEKEESAKRKGAKKEKRKGMSAGKRSSLVMSKDDRSNSSIAGAATVRTRWAPKPEQILILESIFNSGMVNPPKDETVRIRKLLEKFGAVGDANVFYWFQNRRSRSRIRRRQRELQAASAASSPSASPSSVASCFLHLDINNRCSSSSSSVSSPASSSSSGLAAELEGGPVGVGCGDDVFHVPQQTGPINPLWCSSSSDANNYHQPGQEQPNGVHQRGAMGGSKRAFGHESHVWPKSAVGPLLRPAAPRRRVRNSPAELADGRKLLPGIA